MTRYDFETRSICSKNANLFGAQTALRPAECNLRDYPQIWPITWINASKFACAWFNFHGSIS